MRSFCASRPRAAAAAAAGSLMKRGAVARRHLSFPATEFTLAPYREGSEFGFGRGTQYCMLTLKHELVTADHHKNLQLYVRKQELWRSRVEEVFGLYDSDSSGHLDAQQVTEAMDGISNAKC